MCVSGIFLPPLRPVQACPLTLHLFPPPHHAEQYQVINNHIQYQGRNNNLSFRCSSPISNSVTAMEIWLLFCLLMTFLPALQFTFTLNYIAMSNTTQHSVPSRPPTITSNSLPAHVTNKQTILVNSSPKMKDNYRQSTFSSSANIAQHLQILKDIKQVKG